MIHVGPAMYIYSVYMCTVCASVRLYGRKDVVFDRHNIYKKRAKEGATCQPVITEPCTYGYQVLYRPCKFLDGRWMLNDTSPEVVRDGLAW